MFGWLTTPWLCDGRAESVCNGAKLPSLTTTYDDSDDYVERRWYFDSVVHHTVRKSSSMGRNLQLRYGSELSRKWTKRNLIRNKKDNAFICGEWYTVPLLWMANTDDEHPFLNILSSCLLLFFFFIFFFYE